MIYTITWNPSIDYIVSVKEFRVGEVNRAVSESMFPGGKGLNVSMVLKNMGVDNTALGFIAGFTGKEIERQVKQAGVRSELIHVPCGCSRINLKLKSNQETEINGCGPEIKEKEIKELYQKLGQLKEGDILVLAGSIPNSMPMDSYKKIIKPLAGKGILFVIDAEKELLSQTLEFQPFLVKPNQYELGGLFHVECRTKQEVTAYAQKVREMGARNILVSMASEGAILLTEEGNIYYMPAPKGEVKNSVGAGDSMVAGFLAGWVEKKDYFYALKKAVSAGSATAFSEWLATKEEIEKILGQIG
ncbi:MAG: 1-phosphofructokinase [Lachnospiraceae bacterium]|nr:1-phosphofructokinase [Lachnospiraceae bacterium]